MEGPGGLHIDTCDRAEQHGRAERSRLGSLLVHRCICIRSRTASRRIIHIGCVALLPLRGSAVASPQGAAETATSQHRRGLPKQPWPLLKTRLPQSCRPWQRQPQPARPGTSGSTSTATLPSSSRAAAAAAAHGSCTEWAVRPTPRAAAAAGCTAPAAATPAWRSGPPSSALSPRKALQRGMGGWGSRQWQSAASVCKAGAAAQFAGWQSASELPAWAAAGEAKRRPSARHDTLNQNESRYRPPRVPPSPHGAGHHGDAAEAVRLARLLGQRRLRGHPRPRHALYSEQARRRVHEAAAVVPGHTSRAMARPTACVCARLLTRAPGTAQYGSRSEAAGRPTCALVRRMRASASSCSRCDDLQRRGGGRQWQVWQVGPGAGDAKRSQLVCTNYIL